MYPCTYLLFDYNDNKFSDETQEKSRSDTVPQRHKHKRYKVRDELASQETKPFVQIPSNKRKSSGKGNCGGGGDPGQKYTMEQEVKGRERVKRRGEASKNGLARQIGRWRNKGDREQIT